MNRTFRRLLPCFFRENLLDGKSPRCSLQFWFQDVGEILEFPHGFLQSHRNGQKMGRLLTLVRGHYQGLLFHNMNMMQTMKVLCSREMAPISHLNSKGCHCSVGGGSVVLKIAGSSKNLIFAVWMDPNGFGKKPFGDRCV